MFVVSRQQRICRKEVANPLALLLAAAMMLEHIDRSDLAHLLRQVIPATLNEDKGSPSLTMDRLLLSCSWLFVRRISE